MIFKQSLILFNKHKALIALLSISLIYRIIHFEILHPYWVGYCSDSVTYFTQVNIFKGIVDSYRTPIYPLLIHFFEWISKEQFVRNIIFFQQYISFISIIPFYFVSKKVFKNNALALITVLLYGCWNTLIDYNVYIVPESLCIAGSTFFLYFLFRYLENPSKTNICILCLFPIVLIFLKPTYLIILCLIVLFLIFRRIHIPHERIILKWGYLSCLITILVILGYCQMNKSHNGCFVLSKITVNNSLANIIASGTYTLGGDKELISLIDTTKSKGIYTSVFYINNEWIDNYKELNKKSIQYIPNTGDMIDCINAPNSINYPYSRISLFISKSQLNASFVRYLIIRIERTFIDYRNLFSILIVELIILYFGFKKSKEVNWLLMVTVFFILGQFATIILSVGQFTSPIIGKIDDVDRLLTPSYPFLIIVLMVFVEMGLNILNNEKLIKQIT